MTRAGAPLFFTACWLAVQPTEDRLIARRRREDLAAEINRFTPNPHNVNEVALYDAACAFNGAAAIGGDQRNARAALDRALRQYTCEQPVSMAFAPPPARDFIGCAAEAAE